jgi:hypothetical protein
MFQDVISNLTHSLVVSNVTKIDYSKASFASVIRNFCDWLISNTPLLLFRNITKVLCNLRKILSKRNIGRHHQQ